MTGGEDEKETFSQMLGKVAKQVGLDEAKWRDIGKKIDLGKEKGKDQLAKIKDASGGAIDFVKDKSGKGITVEKLTDRVMHALTAKRPRSHYPMGTDTLGYRMMNMLPPRMVDTMLATSLGHTPKGVEPDSD